MPPKNRSVHSVSKEMGVGEIMIHRWISQIKDGILNLEQDEENPSGQRNMTEKLNLLLEYQKIPQEENGITLVAFYYQFGITPMQKRNSEHFKLYKNR